MKDKVRMGVIGIGTMGAAHCKYIQDGAIKRCELTAVCDMNGRQLDTYPRPKHYTDSRDIIRSGDVDAVIIATPHYQHTTIGIDALENGLHVLVEKPISVHKADCERLIAAAKKNPDLVFAAMFNQRTNPIYQKLKKLIDTGELGAVMRINWIITDWFRTQSYYASGGWRATWKGEGGGVLLNQCPHQLDLFQWMFGMPLKIRAFCGFGVMHDIEVEDQVTCYMEFADNVTSVFIASTGEAPGTNRLEIACDRGRVVLENNRIKWQRTEESVMDFCRNAALGFAKPDTWDVLIGAESSGPQHQGITQNFVDAILDAAPLIAPGEEGIKSVELANSMIYSSLTDSTVTLPLDSAAYEAMLNNLIANSKYQKKMVDKQEEDITASWNL